MPRCHATAAAAVAAQQGKRASSSVPGAHQQPTYPFFIAAAKPPAPLPADSRRRGSRPYRRRRRLGVAAGSGALDASVNPRWDRLELPPSPPNARRRRRWARVPPPPPPPRLCPPFVYQAPSSTCTNHGGTTNGLCVLGATRRAPLLRANRQQCGRCCHRGHCCHATTAAAAKVVVKPPPPTTWPRPIPRGCTERRRRRSPRPSQLQYRSSCGGGQQRLLWCGTASACPPVPASLLFLPVPHCCRCRCVFRPPANHREAPPRPPSPWHVAP